MKTNGFQGFEEYVENPNKNQCFQLDNENEYCNKQFQDVLKTNGMYLRLSVSHTPEQPKLVNG